MVSLHYCLNYIGLVFINYSQQRNITFYVESSSKAPISELNSIESKGECTCQIRRALDDEFIEVKHMEHIPKRDPNTEYNQYILYNTENIELKFDTFDKIGNENLNVGIFLCHHIKEFEFSIFYKFKNFLLFTR
ncbi:hypothetical protein LUQ84_002539 [Hamiltosporidium tvaerminnensis]|nr:hypothetical protein LUQ84_002539 [Hamiltosporidium tvaerminnensis]